MLYYILIDVIKWYKDNVKIAYIIFIISYKINNVKDIWVALLLRLH